MIEKGSYVHTLSLDDQKYLTGDGIRSLAKYLESTSLTKLSLKGNKQQHNAAVTNVTSFIFF